MKRSLILAIFITSVLSSCQPALRQREIFAIHIHGDWCRTCKKIDNVIHSLEPFFANKKNVTYLVFDETDPAKVKASSLVAKEHGLEQLFEYERHTGELLFVDKARKEVLTRFYGVNDPKIYINAVDDLLLGKSVDDIVKKAKSYYLSKPSAEEIRKAKLYVVDIHHDMCGSCSITAPIFEEVAKDYRKNEDVSFFTFDLTSPETVDQTREVAKLLDIKEIYDAQKHTGEVLFIDASRKEIIKTLIMERDFDEYHDIIKDFLKSQKRRKRTRRS